MSNARSPREVCSTTWEFKGSCRLLASGGPGVRFGRGGFLVGSPKLVARLRQVGRNSLHLADDPVERFPEAEVCAQRLEAIGFAQLGDDLIRFLAGGFCLLADQLLDLLVRYLDAELVCGGLEDKLARDGLRSLGA